MLNSIFNFIDTRNKLSVHYSGFCAGDSCYINSFRLFMKFTMLFMPILAFFFFDISKAFDRVWHKGLSYKLKCMGINGHFLKLPESFLSNRYQHVVLNGQESSWADIKTGVPQGSILDPLFFLIYINDI